jgi:OsmC subfamily peroxiredoxin
MSAEGLRLARNICTATFRQGPSSIVFKDGKGAIWTKSGALKDYPYGFSSRFEGKPGTSPEELIGAAHAGCFTMALSLILGEAKLTAEQMETTAEVTRSTRWPTAMPSQPSI